MTSSHLSRNEPTPGPWFWINDNYLENAQGETVLEVGDDGRDWGLHSCLIRHNSNEATKAANARLIAAAPDLLEALTECLALLDPFDHKATEAKARAAIQKARGEA